MHNPPSSESSEAALVQARLDVAVPYALQIYHGRSDVAMSHPLLQGSDIDAVLQMARGIGVAEFMQEPAAAVGALTKI
jgi:hypothetical protein